MVDGNYFELTIDSYELIIDNEEVRKLKFESYELTVDNGQWIIF